jgi:hypothetical protein
MHYPAMLRSSYTYRSKGGRRGRGAGTHIREREMPREVEELLVVVERFSEMGSDLQGRFSQVAYGDHAWISIIDAGFVLHAYFYEQIIRFELYGPKPVGKEKGFGHPYDGSGLSGELDADTLKGVIRLLDQGQWPREYVQENARKCSVVAD